MARLGDICTFQSGGTPSRSNAEFFNGSIPWITTVALSGGEIDGNDAVEWITEKAISNSAAKIVPANSVMVGTRVGVGKVAINSVPMSTSQDVISLVGIDETKWDKHYICEFLSSKKEYLNSQARGATIRGIKIEVLANLVLPDITLVEQVQVADNMHRISELIYKQHQQLEKLDDLIKARFVEMFGDPISNEKGWQIAPLTAVCSKIYGGGTPSKSHPEYFEGAIPWVSPKDMKSDVITDSIDHITEEAIENSTTNLIPKGSVLMVIRSGILKHDLPVAINVVPVTINQDMKAFVPGESITASFLRNYFKAIEQDVLAGVRGVTADNIDFKSFQQREIIIPPIYLQNVFEVFCKQVDKSKSVVQKALDEAQTLFDSLMQKYFG